MDGQRTGAQEVSLNHEREARAISGWPMLVAVIVFFAAVGLFVGAGVLNDQGRLGTGGVWGMVAPAIVMVVAAMFASPGFFTLEPNETRVLVLFGAYNGTVRQTGFRWANPFYSNGPAAKTGLDAAARQAAERDRAAKKSQSQAHAAQVPRYKVSVRARTLNGPTPQGERPARQPGGDRGRGHLARERHRPGRL